MRAKLNFQVKPKLPSQLESLKRVCTNLWYAWHPEAVDLFHRMDSKLWAWMQHNPVALLNHISQQRLEALAQDGGFLAELERVSNRLESYLSSANCPFLSERSPENFTVAYLSAEYGLTDALPIYSGGLGMLSGDHLKSASDLNLPLVGVGLAYGQGYFIQYLNPDGWQQEEYRANDFWNMPMNRVTDNNGDEVRISVDIEGRPLRARVWRVDVGRIPLYLLDANLEENPAELRAITYQLYGGDRQMRIRQEILLGIGGVRLLKALGIEANVIHMNEGHSAFASLERIRLLRQEQGLSFDEAYEVVKASSCFTTHTPVPAGNDYFDPELVRRHFSAYVGELGISMPVLMGFGRIHPRDQEELFCMTVLALRTSCFNNGVSRLHGRVSREMWKDVWPHFPTEDLPITHITNGVHIPSWLSNDMAYLLYRYLGPAWVEDPDSQSAWAALEEVPDAEIWRAHERRRARLVAFIRSRLMAQLQRRGGSAESFTLASEVLDPETLTIVFARRFATYKRAVLLLRDLDRLSAILNDPARPVQMIFAGKAHPLDQEGKEFIRQVASLQRDPRFRQRLIFLEDYDMNVARYLVQGADVWLNTPRRPLEACGTSGMKATANGALNLSILDGWWDEGFKPGLGWAIGAGEEYDDPETQDQIEARAVFRILEDEVVPLFYRRDEHDLPRGWIDYMKSSMAVLCAEFNTHRMVEDYADRGYLPAAGYYNALAASEFKGAQEIGSWVRRIKENWSQVQVLGVESPARESLTWGEEIEVRAQVSLGELLPEEVACDIYFGPLGADGNYLSNNTGAMTAGKGTKGVYEFAGKVTTNHTGRLGLNVRVVPHHPLLASKYALGLAMWG